METDPVVAEVRAIREQLASRLGFRLHEIVKEGVGHRGGEQGQQQRQRLSADDNARLIADTLEQIDARKH